MSKIKARNVSLKAGGKTLSGIKDCQITLTTVTNDARVKAGGKIRTFERVDWTAAATVELGHESGASSEATVATIKAAAIAGTKMTLEFTISGESYLSGQAMVSSYTENHPVDGRASYSVNFKGTGPIAPVEDED